MTEHIKKFEPNEEKYNGPERRSEEAVSRRHGDVFCVEHYLRWAHHDKDTSEHRDTVCSKIHYVHDAVKLKADQKEVNEMKIDIRSLLPKWVFVITLPASFAFALILFVWTANTIKDGQTKIETGLSVIHKRITDNDKDYDSLKDGMTELKWSVNALSTRISEVEKKLPK